MVNHKASRKRNSTKSRLLHLLKQHRGDYISGSILSEKLELSRVAVWKAIQTLQSQGIKIEAEKKGYILKSLPEEDLDIENIGYSGEVFYFNQTGSTMDESRFLLSKEEQDFLVIAGEQTQGKARNNRPWPSPAGGLFMTLSRVTEIPLNRISSLSLEILFRVALYFQEQKALPIKVKWPSDLYLNGKKIGGLLTEIEASGERVTRISLGLGLNVNNPSKSGGVSLKEATGKEWSREELISQLAEIKKKVLIGKEKGEESEFSPELLLQGSARMFHFNGLIFSGEIRGLTKDGNLQIQDRKTSYYFSPGECNKLEFIEKGIKDEQFIRD